MTLTRIEELRLKKWQEDLSPEETAELRGLRQAEIDALRKDQKRPRQKWRRPLPAELTDSILDVFMPEDLCARCGEEEPSTKYCLLATPSPSSKYTTTKLFFCSESCKLRFVVGWKAMQECGFEF